MAEQRRTRSTENSKENSERAPALRSSRSEIFFRMHSILRSRISGERQGNAKGTLLGTLQERVP